MISGALLRSPAGTQPQRADGDAPPYVASRYRLLRRLGSGGMGEVWLGEDELLDRIVALKRVAAMPGRREALREARAAGRISHPNVVRVHDVLLTDAGAWIVMEALGGLPLSRAIRRQRRLEVPQATRIGLAVLDALEAVHETGLVHRDVKPGNIQLDERDRVVLTDFGITCSTVRQEGPRAAVVIGSLPYLAPESVHRGEFGPASDLFALGVTLFKAVEGRLPFARALRPLIHGAPMGDVLAGLLESDPRWRSDVDDARRGLRLLLDDVAEVSSCSCS